MTRDNDVLEREHSRLVLVQAALRGLDDLAAGRVFLEVELDRLYQPVLAFAPGGSDDMEAGVTRQEALQRTSDDYLLDAHGVSAQGAMARAYHSGYVALLSAVPDDIAAGGVDRPSATAAADGARRLCLSEAVVQFAQQVANEYIECAICVRSRLAW